MCKAITKKGTICLKPSKGDYCHIHSNKNGHSQFDSRTELIKRLKGDITNKNNALKKKNNEIKDLKLQLEKSNEILSYLEEKSMKYEEIINFEQFKSQIRTVLFGNGFKWKAPFYIEDIRKETKYHNVLKNVFKMDIDNIIKVYYEKRIIRNNYCHPFG